MKKAGVGKKAVSKAVTKNTTLPQQLNEGMPRLAEKVAITQPENNSQQHNLLAQHPITRRSARLTPNKAQTAFELRDEEDNVSQDVQPPPQPAILRRSARLSPMQPSHGSDTQTTPRENVCENVRRSLQLDANIRRQPMSSTPQSNQLSNEEGNERNLQDEENSESTPESKICVITCFPCLVCGLPFFLAFFLHQ